MKYKLKCFFCCPERWDSTYNERLAKWHFRMGVISVLIAILFVGAIVAIAFYNIALLKWVLAIIALCSVTAFVAFLIYSVIVGGR